ncbi:hypothetical protein [Barnesiella viscericola]|uniref:hypothetical protein n=1 Tax=Barnesiella viscericola TaxID=397865 RepID=UPI0023522A07|nr:hypothetical protein [Barnesiella viscericola]
MSEESTPTENSEKEDEESWGIPRTLTLDEIFRELRKAREEAERQEPEEKGSIPRAPKRPHRQQEQTTSQSRPQKLEQRQPQTEWQLDSPSAPAQAPAKPVAKPRPASVVPSAPEAEGVSVFSRTPAFATAAPPRPVPTEGSLDAPAIDVGEIDWRKAVIVSEILNRKY